LTGLPESLGQLAALTTLDLSWCRALTGLPESLGQLAALTTLDLSDCDRADEIAAVFRFPCPTPFACHLHDPWSSHLQASHVKACQPPKPFSSSTTTR
jgi:hypothetical protein